MALPIPFNPNMRRQEQAAQRPAPPVQPRQPAAYRAPRAEPFAFAPGLRSGAMAEICRNGMKCAALLALALFLYHAAMPVYEAVAATVGHLAAAGKALAGGVLAVVQAAVVTVKTIADALVVLFVVVHRLTMIALPIAAVWFIRNKLGN